jgi:hypothetical protein
MIWEGAILGTYLMAKGFTTPQPSPQATALDSRPAMPVAIAAR